MHVTVHLEAEELTFDMVSPGPTGRRSFGVYGISTWITATDPAELRNLAQRLVLHAEEWEDDLAEAPELEMESA